MKRECPHCGGQAKFTGLEGYSWYMVCRCKAILLRENGKWTWFKDASAASKTLGLR